MFVLDRAVAKLIDHHDGVAVVADSIVARVILDGTVENRVLGPDKKHRAITGQHGDPGGQGFPVFLTFFA
ncbi:hypothetical protein D9M71_776870 [compost metagenome]